MIKMFSSLGRVTPFVCFYASLFLCFAFMCFPVGRLMGYNRETLLCDLQSDLIYQLMLVTLNRFTSSVSK